MLDETTPPFLAAFDLELRRGVLVLAVLSRLDREEYGYSLKKALSDAGLEIDEGTLYPLLRRLESQGLLASEWRVVEGRPRRYYRLSSLGAGAKVVLTERWRSVSSTLTMLLDGGTT